MKSTTTKSTDGCGGVLTDIGNSPVKKKAIRANESSDESFDSDDEWSPTIKKVR